MIFGFKFPSPFRGLYLQILDFFRGNAEAEEGFRPHSGDYISKYTLHFRYHHRTCFRPHSGDYISKYCPLHPLYFFILRSIMRGKVNCIWKYSFNGLQNFKNHCIFWHRGKINLFLIHIVPSYILFPYILYISKYAETHLIWDLYNVYG